MSGDKACKCPERLRPLRSRHWRITQRYCNHSAFNGYHRTSSDYSAIVCAECNAHWRTKAAYVGALKDINREAYAAHDKENY